MSNLSIVAPGFVQDAKKLVKAFAEAKSFELRVFSDVWAKQNFSMIYLLRPNHKELLEFTRHIFRLTLELFCEFTENIYEHVGYLYLLFALFRSQPLKPRVKVRVTLEHFDLIEKLRDDAEEKKHVHVLFAIRYLIHEGFDFVCSPTLMGPLLSKREVDVDLNPEISREVRGEAMTKACKIQEDLESCFEELKIVKTEYEKDMSAAVTVMNPYAVQHNKPFQAFLNALEPDPPGTSSEDQDPIGKRRALLKAAAYNKIILHSYRRSRNPAYKVKRETGKVGGPKKQLVEDETTEVGASKQMVLTKLPKPRKRGKRQERLFKKKYLFLEGVRDSESSSSPGPELVTPKIEGDISSKVKK